MITSEIQKRNYEGDKFDFVIDREHFEEMKLKKERNLTCY